MALFDDQGIWRNTSWTNSNVFPVEATDELVGRHSEPIRPERQWRRSVVELHPGLGGVEPKAIEPALSQPPRVRQRDAQVVERRGPVRGVLRLRGERQSVSSARDRAQHGIHEATCALFARSFGEVDRIIHDGSRRNASQVEELIRAQPEDLDDLRVEAVQGTSGECDQHVVEGGTPTLDTRRDLGGQSHVALVGQAAAGQRDCGRKVRAAGGDRPQDFERRGSSTSDHSCRPNIDPTRAAWPARNSRAVNPRRPSG